MIENRTGVQVRFVEYDQSRLKGVGMGFDPSWIVLRKSARSLDQQIHDSVRDRILDGRLQAGDRLPSSRALSASLGVARSTVVSGYERLRAAGYVECRPGVAMRVANLPSAPVGSRAEQDARSFLPASLRAPYLPFQPGTPDLGSFPDKIWARCLSARARNLRVHDLGYEEEAGLLCLREAVLSHVIRTRGVLADVQQVLIMPSTASILGLLGQVLFTDKSCVLVEDPTYMKAVNIFSDMGARVVSCPCDAEGLSISEQVADMIYVTPSHQYPTGVSMSLARRLALLDVAKRSDALIIEDDYDSEFHYAGRPVAALQGIDRSGRVIYVGTFSKTLAPGLRVAYAIVPQGVMARLAPVLRRSRGMVSVHVQAALADFIRDGHFRAHLRRMTEVYRERMGRARQMLGEYFDVGAGAGGLQIAAALREKDDDRALVAFLQQEGIGTSSLSEAYRLEKTHGLVAGIAYATEQHVLKFRNVLEKARKERLI